MSELDSATSSRALINLDELREVATFAAAATCHWPTFSSAIGRDVLALVEAVEAAQEVLDVFECRCHDAYTGRGLHGPYCEHEDGDRLRAALEPFAAPGTGASQSGQS